MYIFLFQPYGFGLHLEIIDYYELEKMISWFLSLQEKCNHIRVLLDSFIIDNVSEYDLRKIKNYKYKFIYDLIFEKIIRAWE